MYLSLFYITSVNSSSSEILQVQEASLHGYRSIHSEGHKLHILFVNEDELVAINCFSSVAAIDFCLEQTPVIYSVFMLNSNEKGV